MRASIRSLRSRVCRKRKEQPEGLPCSKTVSNTFQKCSLKITATYGYRHARTDSFSEHRRSWSDRNKLTLQASEDLACRRSGSLGDPRSVSAFFRTLYCQQRSLASRMAFASLVVSPVDDAHSMLRFLISHPPPVKQSCARLTLTQHSNLAKKSKRAISCRLFFSLSSNWTLRVLQHNQARIITESACSGKDSAQAAAAQ